MDAPKEQTPPLTKRIKLDPAASSQFHKPHEPLSQLYAKVYRKILSGESEPNRTAVKHVGLAIVRALEQKPNLVLIPIGRLPKLRNEKRLAEEDINLSCPLSNIQWSRLHGVLVKHKNLKIRAYIDLGGCNAAVFKSESSVKEVSTHESFKTTHDFLLDIIKQAKTNLTKDDIHVEACNLFKEKYLPLSQDVANKTLNSVDFKKLLSPDKENDLPFDKSIKNTEEKIDWSPIPLGIQYDFGQNIPKLPRKGM